VPQPFPHGVPEMKSRNPEKCHLKDQGKKQHEDGQREEGLEGAPTRLPIHRRIVQLRIGRAAQLRIGRAAQLRIGCAAYLRIGRAAYLRIGRAGRRLENAETRSAGNTALCCLESVET